jgi:Electron transfer DM13
MSFLGKYRWPLVFCGVVVLAALWYAFRPEKLFVTQRVNEAAPVTSTDQPLLVSTTRLSGNLHPTSGRASIFKLKDGTFELRLTDFSTSNGPDVHVVLAASTDPAIAAKTPGVNLQSPLELGKLKGNEGNQNYNIPSGADLVKQNEVVIYCERFHAVFGSGDLQTF